MARNILFVLILGLILQAFGCSESQTPGPVEAPRIDTIYVDCKTDTTTAEDPGVIGVNISKYIDQFPDISISGLLSPFRHIRYFHLIEYDADIGKLLEDSDFEPWYGWDKSGWNGMADNGSRIKKIEALSNAKITISPESVIILDKNRQPIKFLSWPNKFIPISMWRDSLQVYDHWEGMVHTYAGSVYAYELNNEPWNGDEWQVLQRWNMDGALKALDALEASTGYRPELHTAAIPIGQNVESVYGRDLKDFISYKTDKYDAVTFHIYSLDRDNRNVVDYKLLETQFARADQFRDRYFKGKPALVTEWGIPNSSEFEQVYKWYQELSKRYDIELRHYYQLLDIQDGDEGWIKDGEVFGFERYYLEPTRGGQAKFRNWIKE